MRTAVIDIGTNTINLLIADIRDDDNSSSYNIILETACPAKLGKGGINKLTILPDAFERGINALKTHLETIKKYNVDNIVCIATAALRSASNKDDFIKRAKHELGIDIRIVDGEKEAQLIYDGVKQVVPIEREPVLILDIGGGSNEFILANSNGLIWKHSFDLGVARLLDMFSPSDPITKNDIKKIENYIRPELRELFEVTQQYPVDTLVGASGSFDTIAALIAAIHHPQMDMSLSTSYRITLFYFNELYFKFLRSTAGERLKMKKMPAHRVDTIVLASIFINFIIRELNIKEIWRCAFALKEGTIYQIINNRL